MNAIQLQRGASAGMATRAALKRAKKALAALMHQHMEVAGDRFTVGQLLAVSLCWPSLMLAAGFLASGRLVAALTLGAVAAVAIAYLSRHEAEEGGER